MIFISTVNYSILGQTSFEWWVSGLSQDWNSTNFDVIVLSTGTTQSGSTTSPSGIVDGIYPDTIDGTNRETQVSILGGLSSGQTFQYFCYAQTPGEDANGNTIHQWWYAGSIGGTMPSVDAPSTIYTDARTPNSITVHCSEVSGYPAGYQWFLNGTFIGVTYYWSNQFTFSGLSPGTVYEIGVKAAKDGTSSAMTTALIMTEDNPRPDDWSWSYDIYSGGAVYNTQIINGQIIAYIMLNTEWNDFTSRINQFLTYKGLSTYNFTQVSSDSNCTPSIINEAVNQINRMGFTITTVSDGNIPASVFISMRDSLNSIA